jgi:hypothetical protein
LITAPEARDPDVVRRLDAVAGRVLGAVAGRVMGAVAGRVLDPK